MTFEEARRRLAHALGEIPTSEQQDFDGLLVKVKRLRELELRISEARHALKSVVILLEDLGTTTTKKKGRRA